MLKSPASPLKLRAPQAGATATVKEVEAAVKQLVASQKKEGKVEGDWVKLLVESSWRHSRRCNDARRTARATLPPHRPLAVGGRRGRLLRLRVHDHGAVDQREASVGHAGDLVAARLRLRPRREARRRRRG